MAKLLAGSIFVLLLLSSAFATDISKRFTAPFQSTSNAWMDTAVSASPTLAVQNPLPVYCVGDTITPVVTVPTSWAPSYNGQLGNSVLDGSESCLIPSSSKQTGIGINWRTNSQMSGTIRTGDYEFFNNINEFQGAPLIGTGATRGAEASRYLHPFGGFFGGTSTYSADVAMFCSGKLSIVSNNPGYPAITIANDFTGSVPAIPPITLSTAGTINFQTQLDFNSCSSFGITRHSGSCPLEASVWRYDASGGGAAQSPAVQVIVRPSYACSSFAISRISPQTITATQGQPVQVQFRVSNNGPTAVTVGAGAITATLNGVSTPITINSPALPFTIQQGGAPVDVTGTITPPSSNPPSQPLAISVSGTTADCTNTVCLGSVSFTLNVNPSGGITCDPLALSSPGPFNVGNTATATATCRQQGGGLTACPLLTWTTTNNIGSMSPSQHQTASTFTATNPGSGRIKADNDAQNVHCITPADVVVNGGAPVRCDLSGVPATIPQGGSATAVAACFDANNFAVPCQQLAWTTSIQPAIAMNPPTTNSPPNPPQSVLNVPLTTPVQANREVRASASGFSCFKPIAVVAGGGGIARSCLLSSVPPGPDFASPSTVALTANCKDTANPNDPNAQNVACPPMRWQQTVASGVTLPSSTSGGTNTMAIAAGVSAVFPQTITATSNDPAINPPFSCTEQFSIGQGSGGGSLRITACDVDKPLYQPGESGVARAHCADSRGAPADCPQLAWSTPNSPNYVNLVPPLITDPAPTPVRKEFVISSNALPTPPQFIGIRCNNPSDCDPAFSQCPSPLQVNIGSGGDKPDYIAIVTPVANYYEFGQTAVITVVTKNIGAGPTTESSTTLITDDNGCAADPHTVGGIGSDSHDYRCACSESTYGLHVITAVADAVPQPNGAIDESNEDNNGGNNIFYCCPAGGCQPLACFDYF